MSYSITNEVRVVLVSLPAIRPEDSKFVLGWCYELFPTNLNIKKLGFVQHENENKAFSILSHSYLLEA